METIFLNDLFWFTISRTYRISYMTRVNINKQDGCASFLFVYKEL